MKTTLRSIAALATLATLVASGAQATPIRLDGPETNLQQIVNNITVGGSSSVDVVNDQYGPDEAWRVNSVFTPSGSIVLELAGYAGVNRLGLYDIYNSNSRVELFSGSDGVGATTLFDIGDNGQVYRNHAYTGVTFASSLFGFYLETPDGVWYSQSDLNWDQADHLIAYQGQGDKINTPLGARYWTSETFLLAWEDLASNSWDQDYNDMVVFVSGINGVQVPEPMTLGLFGLGLVAIGLTRRRKTLS